MHASIFLKMVKSCSFQEYLGFLFYACDAMGNEIYKQHGFFLYIYMCVDVVGQFVMDLVIMIHCKRYTYL